MSGKKTPPILQSPVQVQTISIHIRPLLQPPSLSSWTVRSVGVRTYYRTSNRGLHFTKRCHALDLFCVCYFLVTWTHSSSPSLPAASPSTVHPRTCNHLVLWQEIPEHWLPSFQTTPKLVGSLTTDPGNLTLLHLLPSGHTWITVRPGFGAAFQCPRPLREFTYLSTHQW